MAPQWIEALGERYCRECGAPERGCAGGCSPGGSTWGIDEGGRGDLSRYAPLAPPPEPEGVANRREWEYFHAPTGDLNRDRLRRYLPSPFEYFGGSRVRADGERGQRDAWAALYRP